MARRWGAPRETLLRACRELELAGVSIVCASSGYWTKPVGDTPQPRYLNAVLLAKAYIAPGALLRLLKRIERFAGRRSGRAMASRPLDLDILDYGGRRIGWPARRRQRGRLILPHPEMHKRAFVLVPLLEVAPAWRHPVSGRRVKALLTQLTPVARANVRQTLDSATNTCDKVPS
ncbi:MAG: 2-amino-4-hydroxy-6-hydroxymethyldihydropteridine diphosphokinase [Pseudomonadota bacterium]|nr:2-amino-4-hydroxy-6-hydroxymethyldihydropteridine diphosphokinase [Pseudomonadota bacterium]